VINLD